MSLQVLATIISLCFALGGIVYAFGNRDARLKELEDDLNGLGDKHSEKIKALEDELKSFHNRLNRNNEFRLLADQRVLALEVKILGEEKSDRLRGISTHHTTVEEVWRSDNSGIDL